MPLSVDVKPIGVFIEYTFLPLIERSVELLDRMEAQKVHPEYILKKAIRMFVIGKLIDTFTTLVVTGAICTTLYLLLHSRHMLQ